MPELRASKIKGSTYADRQWAVTNVKGTRNDDGQHLRIKYV